MPKTTYSQPVRRLSQKLRTGALGFHKEYVRTAKLPALFAFVLFGLVLLGGIGVILLQPYFEQPQEVRKQAAIEGGFVIVQPNPISGSNVNVNQAVDLDLLVNTQQTMVDGVQLFFQVNSQLFAPTLSAASGFQLAYQEVTSLGGGNYQIKLIAIKDTIGQGFATSQYTPFARISWVAPNAPTDVVFSFDNSLSISTINGSNPPTDTLQTVQNWVYHVIAPTCTYTYSDWSACVNGQQTRIITSETPVLCVGTPEALTQTCSVTCTYTYSNWSSCVNGQQTRTIASQTPAGCTGGPDILQRACTEIGDDLFFPANPVQLTFFDETTNQTVDINNLHIGHRIRLHVQYKGQNVFKDPNYSSNLPITVTLNLNGQTITQTLAYGLFVAPVDGASGGADFIFYPNTSNNLTIRLDTANVLAETNENNNTWSINFNGLTDQCIPPWVSDANYCVGRCGTFNSCDQQVNCGECFNPSLTLLTSCLSGSTNSAVARATWNASSVTYIDISANRDFAGFSNKYVAGTTQTDILTGFNGSTTQISPNTTYYVRLYNSNGQHSGVTSFSIPACSDNGTLACNQSCTSHAQCQLNQVCYQNRCRLSTNPTSDTCVNPPDMGIHRTCNQYCADTNECAAGYTCWYNQCRLPSYVDSPTCTVPTTYVIERIRLNCNRVCDSNSQCGVNLRCYDGFCRSATNPLSPTCSGQRVVIVDNEPGKGEEMPEPFTLPSPSSSASASVKPSASPSDTWGYNKYPSPLPSPTPTSALDDVIANLTDRGLSLPLLALGAGLLLLIIGILIALFSKPKNPPPTVYTYGAAGRKRNSYEQDLDSRIQALRQQTAAAPTPGTTQPVHTPVARPTNSSSSSMLQRLKSQTSYKDLR